MTKFSKNSQLPPLAMAASSPVASEKGTTASFSFVETDAADGEDYMLIDMPKTEARWPRQNLIW